MTGIRITTRTDLKSDIENMYESIACNNPQSALRHLKSVEKNIVMYYNTRGIACDEFFPIFFKIRNLLRKFRKSNMYRRRIHEYLLELNRQLRGNIDPAEAYTGKVILGKLKQLSADLMDDYSEFNLAGGGEFYESNSKVLELMRNDLLEMKEMDSLFLKMDKERLPLILEILTSINACLVILPQAKEVTISTNTVKTFRTSFEGLFNHFSVLFMPVVEEKPQPTIESIEGMEDLKGVVKAPSVDVQDKHYLQKKPEIIKKDVQKGDDDEPGAENKSLNKMAKEHGMDLKEMERKAKERLMDEPETEDEG